MAKILGALIFLWGLVDTILSYTDDGDLWYQLFGIILPDPLYQFAGMAAMIIGAVIFSIGNEKSDK